MECGTAEQGTIRGWFGLLGGTLVIYELFMCNISRLRQQHFPGGSKGQSWGILPPILEISRIFPRVGAPRDGQGGEGGGSA